MKKNYCEKHSRYGAYKLIGNATVYDPQKSMLIVEDKNGFPHAVFCSREVYDFMDDMSNGDTEGKYEDKIFWIDSLCECDCVVMFDKADCIQGYHVRQAIGNAEEHYNIYEFPA